jgi:hypothetical protein
MSGLGKENSSVQLTTYLPTVNGDMSNIAGAGPSFGCVRQTLSELKATGNLGANFPFKDY